MSLIVESAVIDALRTVQEPELGGDLVTRQMVKDLAIDGTAVAFTIASASASSETSAWT